MRFLFWTGEHFTRDADRFYFYDYGYNRLGYLFIEIFETATTTEKITTILYEPMFVVV